MSKIQFSTDGVAFVSIPKAVVKEFGWQKGQELFCEPNVGRKEIVFRAASK